MPAYKHHATIIVEDEMRNENISLSRTNFVYQLTQPVNFFKRSRYKQYFVRIEDIRIPISFRNINSKFNRFVITEGASTVSIALTQGNYTIDELIAELQTQLNAATTDTNVFTLTYDEITQRVNIAVTGGASTVTIVNADLSSLLNSLRKPLGFDVGQTITQGSNTDGNNAAYTNTARHFRIQVDNLTSNNVYANSSLQGGDKQTNLQKVSVVFPVPETRNEFHVFNNHEGAYIKLPNLPAISDLNVKLIDADGNEVDLHNVPWGMNVVFYEYNSMGQYLTK